MENTKRSLWSRIFGSAKWSPDGPYQDNQDLSIVSYRELLEDFRQLSAVYEAAAFRANSNNPAEMRNERIGNRIQKLEDEIERRADTEEGKREIARVSANGSSNISAAMAKHDRRCAADAAYRARTDTLRQEWLAAAVNSAQATETKEKVDSEIKAFTADHESRENALEEAREKAMEELDLLPDNFANEYCDRKKALEKDWSDYCNISRQKYMDAVAESSAAAQVLEIAIKAFQVETGGAALSYMLRVANMEEDTIRRVAALEAKTVANGYNSAEAATAAIMAANIWRKYAI